MRSLRGDLVALGTFLRRGSGEVFSLVSSDRMHVNGSELCHGRFRLDIRTIFFIESIDKHWDRLPGEVVDALGLSAFKRH